MMRVLIAVLLVLAAFPAFAAEPYVFTRQEAEDLAAKELVAQGAGNTLKVSIPGGQSPKLYESAQAFDTELTGLVFDGRSQRFTATLRFLDGVTGQAVGSRDIGGRYAELERIPVLSRRLGAGEVIAAGDITWLEVEQSRLRDDTVTAEAQLLGQSPRRTVAPNRPVRLSELQRPAIVKRNQNVTLVFRKHGLEIKAEGKALQDGGVGELISVENTKSGAQVRGKVINSTTVDVTPGTPGSAQVGTNAASVPAETDNASEEAGSE